MLVDRLFYKVVLLRCNVFESTIEDERHFSSIAEAKAYAELHNDMVSIILKVNASIDFF